MVQARLVLGSYSVVIQLGELCFCQLPMRREALCIESLSQTHDSANLILNRLENEWIKTSTRCAFFFGAFPLAPTRPSSGSPRRAFLSLPSHHRDEAAKHTRLRVIFEGSQRFREH